MQNLRRSLNETIQRVRFRSATVNRAEGVDYRDRVSVATWPLIVGLALSLFVALPTVEMSVIAFGSPASVSITGTLVAAMVLAVLAATGAEAVVSAHPSLALPQDREGARTWPFWALPMAMTIIVTLILPRLPTPLIQVIALLGASLLFVLVFLSLYNSVEVGQSGFRRSRLVLNLLSYAAAVALFLFVYQTRTRSLVSGTLVAITAMLLAIELLRGSASGTGQAINFGAIVGLLLGQVTWALNYWPLPSLTGGLLLLLIFYMLVSLAQNGLQKRLTRRVLIELGLVIAVALLLIVLFGPGFSIVVTE